MGHGNTSTHTIWLHGFRPWWKTDIFNHSKTKIESGKVSFKSPDLNNIRKRYLDRPITVDCKIGNFCAFHQTNNRAWIAYFLRFMNCSQTGSLSPITYCQYCGINPYTIHTIITVVFVDLFSSSSPLYLYNLNLIIDCLPNIIGGFSYLYSYRKLITGLWFSYKHYKNIKIHIR